MDAQQTEFHNIGSFTQNFGTIAFVGELVISNLDLQNITGLSGQGLAFFFLNSYPSTSVLIQSLNVDYYDFSGGGIINIINSIDRFEMNNVNIANSLAYSKIPIFNINFIGSFNFSNFNVEAIGINEQTDEDSVIFYINTLNLESNMNSSLQNFDVSDCAISLLHFGALVNNNSDAIHLEMQNITIRDSVLTSPRSVISTENLVQKSSLYVRISSFYSSNVTFSNRGNILLFSHGLINPIIVEDSIFSNLSSATIYASGSGLEGDLKNEVKFINCSFNHIYSSSQSFIRISDKAIFNFAEISLNSIAVAFDRSGIVDATTNSIVIITKSNFTNNAAVTSTLFAISFGAYVE